MASIAATIALVLTAVAGKIPEKLSSDWRVTGDSPKSYEAGIDSQVKGVHRNAKFLRFVEGNGTSWAALTQNISAENYLGRRVRFQARLKTRNVDQNWAGIWFRVAGEDGTSRILYNCSDVPLTGDNDWQAREAVFDIPEDAIMISFGLLVGGKGQVWADDMKFDIVGNEVPVSQQYRDRPTENKTLEKPHL
ncbi:transcriptional regulator [Undibacterium sp. TS12]|uniref:transcriptional regulator n=1 Tax=Undibacterium sp. TS12 TaxID=2908202 RepID=UPI001F4C58C9|nr:transcriptional regulator [Undibacterium sp. TS12]MCH8620508.1 transcriptional regulator [Undibacterium sp. TS12]